jgi:hypothetical protein
MHPGETRPRASDMSRRKHLRNLDVEPAIRIWLSARINVLIEDRIVFTSTCREE